MSLEKSHIAAILLAAGASSRMGRPKPLLAFGGETFLDRQIALYARYAQPVIAVLGFQASEIAAGLGRAAAAVLVLNPRPESGQLSSLQCGLRALAQTGQACEAVFFLPVDNPGVSGGTLDAMLAAWGEADEKPSFVIPRRQGRRGHPVLMSVGMAAELLALPQTAAARDIVRAHVATTIHVEVDDPAIHLDIDSPDDYAALTAGVRP